MATLTRKFVEYSSIVFGAAALTVGIYDSFQQYKLRTTQHLDIPNNRELFGGLGSIAGTCIFSAGADSMRRRRTQN